jgi:putative transposase
MPRSLRQTEGDIVYHVLNRANGRLQIFRKPGDFIAFEQILAEGIERFDMRICAYCVMGNHWHMVLWPRGDGDLPRFMKWITVTHSHRWHGAHKTVGMGHLYQGRYKSFPIQSNAYYLTLMRYVESNPKRAGLVQRSRQWAWSSLAIRTGADKPIPLSNGPLELPDRWPALVDSFDEAMAEALNVCINRGRPFGNENWVLKTAGALSLESSLRPRGRPKKEEH